MVICNNVVHKKRKYKVYHDLDSEFTEQAVLSYFTVVIYYWSISEPARMSSNTRLSFWEIFVQPVFCVGCDITNKVLVICGEK